MKRCKECKNRVPEDKSLESFACQVLSLCRYCYQMKFPVNNRQKQVPIREVYSHRLTHYERKQFEKQQFGGMEQIIWDTIFLNEWLESLED